MTELIEQVSLLEKRFLTSVRFGDIFFTVDQLRDYIRSSAELLVHVNQVERHEISLRGSATSLRYKGRFWVLTSRHQIDQNEYDHAAILAELPNRYLTAGRCVWLVSAQQLSDSDRFDLIAWEFTPQVERGNLNQSRFRRLLEAEYLQGGDEVVGCFVFGYRMADIEIDWVEEDEALGPMTGGMHTQQREIFCEYHGDGPENSVARLVAANNSLNDLDGLSGSPAFAIVRDGDAFSCKFAGLVVRGGNRNLYLVKHTSIRALLDRALVVS